MRPQCHRAIGPYRVRAYPSGHSPAGQDEAAGSRGEATGDEKACRAGQWGGGRGWRMWGGHAARRRGRRRGTLGAAASDGRSSRLGEKRPRSSEGSGRRAAATRAARLRAGLLAEEGRGG